MKTLKHSSAVAALGGIRLEGALLDGVTGCYPSFLDNHDLSKGDALGIEMLLSKLAGGRNEFQRQLLVVDAVQSGRSLERIVQPSHQVSVDE